MNRRGKKDRKPLKRPEEQEKSRSGESRLLHAVLNSLKNCITILDEKGIVLYANPPFLKLFGISGVNFSGENIVDFFARTHERKLRGFFSKKNGGRRSPVEIGLTGVRRDHTEFPARCLISRIIQDGGKRLLVNVIDRTQELESQAGIEHLQSLASIGTFASGVVHEFNNVLTGIRGYTQLASPDIGNTSFLKKTLSIIDIECQRGAELCRNMSMYSSRTRINREPVELRDIIETVLALQKKFFTSEAITVKLEIGEPPPVMLDRFQIQQVLLNLIINARHAVIPKGGGTITVRLGERARQIVIEVEDDGIGIDRKNISRIFDPFYTSKGPSGMNISGKELKGSGLGLAVSNSIIKKHGGTISVRSKPGAGSRFTLRLPKLIAEKAQIVDSDPSRLQIAFPRRTLRILVTDDEQNIRELLFRALTSMSMEVTLARNAEEAIALCKSDSFDIIFLDYILPEMNGDSIIPVIKQYLPASKIVMISGWASSPIKKKKIEQSVHAWIDKPFDLGQIVSCISELIADGTGAGTKGGLH